MVRSPPIIENGVVLGPRLVSVFVNVIFGSPKVPAGEEARNWRRENPKDKYGSSFTSGYPIVQ